MSIVDEFSSPSTPTTFGVTTTGVATTGTLPFQWTGVKDSGVRQEFDTGSRRDTQEGKGRYDLLPTRAMRELALHFEHGAVKYGDRNWEKGQPISRYLNSAIRHTFQALEGKLDENHMIAAAWNLLCAVDTRARIAAGILPSNLYDLPTSEPQTQSNGTTEGNLNVNSAAVANNATHAL